MTPRDASTLQPTLHEALASEERYRLLFERNPVPMWVYDSRTFEFLAVNDAAVSHYGFTRDEFLAMTICDIRPAEEIPVLLATVVTLPSGLRSPGPHRHRTKDGTLIDVAITSHAIPFDGRDARLVLVTDITAQRRTEAALMRAEAQYRSLVESLPGIVYVAEPEPPYATVYISPAIQLLGYTRDEWLANPDSWTRHLHPDDRERVLAATQAAHAEGCGTVYEYRMIAHDGSVRWFHDQGTFVRNPQGKATLWQGVMTDITQQRRAEEALRQSEARLLQAQKMEAVGQLAGGVAHDFNNLLTVITCHAQFLLETTAETDPQRVDAEEIKNAAARATSLTRQLLAFSRKQQLQPKVVDLNVVVTNLEPMLRRLIGEDIHVVALNGASPCDVVADPCQLEQVLVNLAVNARDAMPGGGTLTVEVSHAKVMSVDSDGSTGRLQTVPPGRYVVLAVTDTGCGMDDDVLAHLFEPFFTTKPPGQGTGLGLSTVKGIVKQAGGHVWVSSEPGRGSTFKVYLPCASADAGRHDSPHAAATLPDRGTETILLVEDEDGVRTLARRILQQHGYTVIEARHGKDALLRAETFGPRIDLVLTDVVMPEMGGPELADALTTARPDLRVLFFSGYTDDDIVRRGLFDPGIAFLQKPFTANALVQAVRKALDSGLGTRDSGVGTARGE